MKGGIFTIGLVVGAVAAAAVIEKKYSFDSMLKKGKNILKKKINDMM